MGLKVAPFPVRGILENPEDFSLPQKQSLNSEDLLLLL